MIQSSHHCIFISRVLPLKDFVLLPARKKKKEKKSKTTEDAV